MQQLSKGTSILYHLYPGIFITAGFILLTPYVVQQHYPPQLSLLFCIVLIALPVLLLHMFRVKKKEKGTSLWTSNGFTNKLSALKLILYAIGLVAFAFVIWGVTQPL